MFKIVEMTKRLGDRSRVVMDMDDDSMHWLTAVIRAWEKRETLRVHETASWEVWGAVDAVRQTVRKSIRFQLYEALAERRMTALFVGEIIETRRGPMVEVELQAVAVPMAPLELAYRTNRFTAPVSGWYEMASGPVVPPRQDERDQAIAEDTLTRIGYHQQGFIDGRCTRCVEDPGGGPMCKSCVDTGDTAPEQSDTDDRAGGTTS